MDENEQTTEGTFEDIITQLIEKIDKPSIKNSLKDSLIINKITSDGVYFITISKVAQLIFSNKENMKYIEEKMAEVMGKSLAINVTFENKENYFIRKLGNI
ncbi:MAG TPA: hypothetical protein PKC87_02435 [Candidatus Absconditabacterales bacterium]|nr:hypothetical protein [Candidatus Absconditabacterales bacterium]